MDRPPKHGLQPLVTSSWSASARPQPLLVWLAPRVLCLSALLRRPSSRAPPSPLALLLSPAQGRSQSPSWLHPGQPGRPHGPFRQELSRGTAGPLCLLFPATTAPRPLPTACRVTEHGWRGSQRPLRVSHVPHPLLPPRPLLRTQVRVARPGVTSIAAELDAPPSVQCDVKFSLKPSRPVPCGLAVPTPRPMTMSTRRATPCCSCLPTPSLRLLSLRTSASWMSSWWPYLAGSPWTFSLLRSKTGPILNPTIWLTILNATSGSVARPRLGLQATARVDVPVSAVARVGVAESFEVSRLEESTGRAQPVCPVSGLVPHFSLTRKAHDSSLACGKKKKAWMV